MGFGSALTMYHYDNVGNLRSFILPNGVNQVYDYNDLNRLTNMVAHRIATPIESYSYELGVTGHRLGVREGNGRQVAYQYDNLYRLTRESVLGASPLGDISYTLDSVGNRVAMNSSVLGIPSQVNTYDANDRLDGDSYDPGGNTTAATIHDSLAGTDTAFTYAYDFENRIVSATSGLSVIHIAYDGDGNRVRKTVTDAYGMRETRYLVDDRNLTGYSQVLEELGETSELKVAYAMGLDVISQTRLMPTNEVTHFYGYDGHGNVRFLTDMGGQITDRWDYDAFGNILARSGATWNNLLYCGEYRDPDLTLYFLRARYMDTSRGRFWTMDVFEGVIHDPVSLHKYMYCGAEPINWIDPRGLERLITLQMAQSIALIAWKTVSNTMVVYNAAMAFVYMKSFASCVYSVWQFNAANNINGSADICFPLFSSGLGYTFKTIFWGLARMTLVRHGYDPFTGDPLY